MQITQTKTGGILSWGEEDWLHGLVPNFQDVTNSLNSVGKGMSWARGIDPYFIPGSLFPGQALGDATTVSVIDAIQKNAITNGDQAYSVGGAKIHNFGAATKIITNNGTFPFTVGVQAGTHSGHTVVLSDIIIYYIATTKYAFYSFNDGTDADVGRYNLSSTFDDDWLSTPVPTSGALLTDKTVPHPMIVGDDDCLYVADGNKLHKIDGQDVGGVGKYYPSKLSLPLGSIITSFAKTANFLVIYAYKPSITSGSYYKSEVKAYFWDYVSEDPTYSYPIAGNYVNGGFNFRGTIGCFVRGLDPNFKTQKGSKMMLFDGAKFVPVPGVSFSEAIPGHGGVEAMENVIRWNSDGVIYQYGSMHGFPDALNRIMIASGSTSEGMLRNLAINLFYVSSGTTTSGGLQSNGFGYYDGAEVIVPQVFPQFPLGYKGRITDIKVQWRYKMSSVGSTAKMSIWYDDSLGAGLNRPIFDNSVTTTANLVDEYQYSFPTTSTTVINFPTFSNLGWRLTYNAGTKASTPDVIQRIEIHYENVKI